MPHAGGATPSPCHAMPCLALQIPYFNAPIFLENKTQIGKVEEILGPINNVVCKQGSGRRAEGRACTLHGARLGGAAWLL